MGNSVRSTLGNLCGGEQAAKESPDDEDRPVSKPKDIKKKEKNKKKNKKDKEKNGDLTLIKEENEPEKPEDEKPTVEDKADNNTDATKVSGDEVEPLKSSNEIKSTAPVTEAENHVNEAEVSDYDDANENEPSPTESINIHEVKQKPEEEQKSSNKINIIKSIEAPIAAEVELIAESAPIELELESNTESEPIDINVDNKNTEIEQIESKSFDSQLEIVSKSADSELELLSKSADSELNISSKFNTSRDDMSSIDGSISNQLHFIFDTVPLVPETIGINYADDIFNNAAEQYEPFVECNEQFKSDVVAFNKSIDQDETIDFEKCWQLHQNLLSLENKNEDEIDMKKRTASKSEVDICDINANLQQIRASGLQLTNEIEAIKPSIEQLLTDAGTVDVIDYVKGKMVEGEQLGITSKFSAPGKYRRNMKQLKKAVKQMEGVDKEAKDILQILDEHHTVQEEQNSQLSVESVNSVPVDDKNTDNKSSSPDIEILSLDDDATNASTMSLSSKAENNKPIILNEVAIDDIEPTHVIVVESLPKPRQVERESIIIPASRTSDNFNDDVFFQLKKDDSTRIIVTRMGEERKPSGEQKKISTSGVTLLEKSAEANIPSTDPITYVIENIAEDGEIDPPSLSSTPRSRKETFEIRETKTPVNNVEVEDEEHNTLDFGKYIFIDPSTGDIQTMRNRSRSLDSLCSMTSNRSSIGRFGSFELVTDFEINIAEKNQENKMAP